MTTTAPILVIGATGKVGRRVVAGLQSIGGDVRIGSRHAALPFDWQDRSNWAEHFVGIDTAYVAYYPDLAAPQGVDDIAALASVAKAAGVRRMVLLSGRGESGAERAEQALRDSGLGYTILRAAWFNQNFSEGHLQPSVMGGIVAMPAGQRLEPFIDVDDIAEVAVAALTDDRGAAVRLADQRQLCLILDAHRPRRIHHHPQYESATRPYSVEQTDHRVHPRSPPRFRTPGA